MRILSVGFDDDFVNELEKELDKYFICIVDNAKDMYDATNFTDFRHYELVIIVDEGVQFSLERYVNEVKKKKSETKIIILTDKPKCQSEFFKLGVDDVVYEHCDQPDLIAARVLANMRHLFGTQVEVDKLVIDIANKRIQYDDKNVSLNGKTFDILAYLALREKRVFSKDEIINALWEEPEYVSDNTVEVAINQIRKRLKQILGFQVIHTVRRRGYKFAY
ncbi:response regulator transcription factor [Sulfurovum sp.]|jgi:DNA-binding response OmpR family regulator|uniref:response regulator transcription factor n=1 Tax=Sulfurovum sp. TaxID=1969726 RepID=UPI002A3628D6|nr:response regulator transcription factor [Sulfurovum sp.]MDD2450893.1 response regulator transcription factor [Sulfurovum sp.]MDD3498764.1 response regulator transcription factor [Sulfurovum sp.]MDY0402045.1 response regulator transcription factor [Sulfurovum sp.]